MDTPSLPSLGKTMSPALQQIAVKADAARHFAQARASR
jgi:hypothetical protein